jgi:hypothetical protein
VRGVYVCLSFGLLGCRGWRPSTRAASWTSLPERVGRSGSQGSRVSGARSAGRRPDLDSRDADATILASPGGIAQGEAATLLLAIGSRTLARSTRVPQGRPCRSRSETPARLTIMFQRAKRPAVAERRPPCFRGRPIAVRRRLSGVRDTRVSASTRRSPRHGCRSDPRSTSRRGSGSRRASMRRRGRTPRADTAPARRSAIGRP